MGRRPSRKVWQSSGFLRPAAGSWHRRLATGMRKRCLFLLKAPIELVWLSSGHHEHHELEGFAQNSIAFCELLLCIQ